MKKKFIIGDCDRGLIWYGAYSPMRFSKPGFTNAIPQLFDSYEEAVKEADKITAAFYPTGVKILAVAEYYIFDNCPPEKTENLGIGKRVYMAEQTETLRGLPYEELQAIAFTQLRLINTNVYIN